MTRLAKILIEGIKRIEREERECDEVMLALVKKDKGEENE